MSTNRENIKKKVDADGLSIAVIDYLAEEFLLNSEAHGFYEELDKMRTLLPNIYQDRFNLLVDGEKIALMHTELSEALEGIRKDPLKPDINCPDFTNETIEYADVIIRILERCARKQLPIGEALIAKHKYNKSRPFRHGKRS